MADGLEDFMLRVFNKDAPIDMPGVHTHTIEVPSFQPPRCPECSGALRLRFEMAPGAPVRVFVACPTSGCVNSTEVECHIEPPEGSP